MEKEKNIYQRFIAAQAEFEAVIKGNNNPLFKSKYADLAAVTSAIIGALNKNGLGLMYRNHESETGVRIEALIISDSGAEISSGIIYVPCAKNDAQGYGSAITYARRYALQIVAGVAAEDDDGNAASNNKTVGLDAEQIGKVRALIKKLGITEQEFSAKYNSGLTVSRFSADRIAQFEAHVNKIVKSKESERAQALIDKCASPEELAALGLPVEYNEQIRAKYEEMKEASL